MSGKAKLEELNNLHNLVASQLAIQVKKGDLKAIEKAIAFLKNNNITVDIVESEPTQSLFSDIVKRLDNPKTLKSSTVEDILAMYA